MNVILLLAVATRMPLVCFRRTSGVKIVENTFEVNIVYAGPTILNSRTEGLSFEKGLI
jgi:hypothetical protein